MAGVSSPATATPVLTDLGSFFAQTILSDVRAEITAEGLAQPGISEFIVGSGVPIADCCVGLLWTRLVTMFPTSGDGSVFAQIRPDFDQPAWGFTIELGILWCHQNLDEEGNFINPAAETGYAVRDGEYRIALLTALIERVPPHLQPCALGSRISPWQPVGPDGGCSGGIVVITLIAASPAALM